MNAQATEFVDRFDLHGRKIVEIGCGHGEFLAAVCEVGANIGLGYDPAFEVARARNIDRGQYSILAERFGRKTQLPDVDFICCRNTLEHIPDVREFVRNLRHAIRSTHLPQIVFQVPAWERIDEARAFWDIYYEHCSYFSARSLENLFLSNGLSATRLNLVFERQYLLIEGRPVDIPSQEDHDFSRGYAQLSSVGERLRASRGQWTGRIENWRESGRKTVIWGGGSKAVAFLSGIGTEGIVGAVDINPNKWGTYLPQSSLPVLRPEDLRALRPDEIVVMNSAYAREISDRLVTMGLSANLNFLD